MKKQIAQLLLSVPLLIFLSTPVAAHCEIPCGIYDDQARISMLLEHTVTIEKSMKQITALNQKQEHNANQLVRWVTNKEHHANQLQTIVSQYFMTQRIKLDAKQYDKKIGLLHQMLIYAMKCKQTTNLNHTEKLKKIINEFAQIYLDMK